MLELPPNATFVYQAILLVALWIALKRLVFDRTLANLHERESRTSGALAEAKRLRDEAASLRTEYEAAMGDVRREAAQARDEIRRRAEAEERELLDSARAEASRTLDAFRAKVAAEVAAARAELARDAEVLAERVAERVLRRGGGSA